MDLSSANAFVMVVSGNFAQYPVETQRSLLEGIFQLADECQDDLDELPDTSRNKEIRTNLILSKILISNALKNGELHEGFRQAAHCFWPMAAPNIERCDRTNSRIYDEPLRPL